MRSSLSHVIKFEIRRHFVLSTPDSRTGLQVCCIFFIYKQLIFYIGIESFICFIIHWVKSTTSTQIVCGKRKYVSRIPDICNFFFITEVLSSNDDLPVYSLELSTDGGSLSLLKNCQKFRVFHTRKLKHSIDFCWIYFTVYVCGKKKI